MIQTKGGWYLHKRIVQILILIIIIITVIVPIISTASRPIFDLAICSDTTSFNKGEKITFKIYLIGAGNITYDYLLFYVDDNMYVDNISMMGFEIKEGLQDKGTNAQAYENLMNDAKQGFANFSPDNLNPLYAGIFNDSSYVPPIKVTISTDENVSYGDHTLKVIYMYKNGDEDWQQISESITFHINSLTEQYEILGFIWNFLPPFLGFGFALFLYWLSICHSKKKEEQEKKQLRDNLSLMIKDEIRFNQDKIGQIKNEARKQLLPTYRLKTINKEASWAQIVKFRYQERDLINNISELYYKYDILNRTIDIGFECFYRKKAMSGLLAEIIRICTMIENKTNEVLEVLN